MRPAADAPVGTFSLSPDSNRPQISYASDLIETPVVLIATFAHEISHLILMTRERPDWMGEAEEELVTDLFAVYLGFGVFLANSAFQFDQSSSFDRQGWSYSRLGYLSEDTLLFAIAMFLAVQRHPEIEITALKPSLRKRVDKAQRQVAALSTEVTELRNLDAAAQRPD